MSKSETTNWPYIASKRLRKVLDLRERGFKFREIGNEIQVCTQRAYQLYVKAKRIRDRVEHERLLHRVKL